jgi:hypothetical protein
MDVAHRQENESQEQQPEPKSAIETLPLGSARKALQPRQQQAAAPPAAPPAAPQTAPPAAPPRQQQASAPPAVPPAAPPAAPPSVPEPPRYTANWDFSQRQAELRVDGKTHKSSDVFPLTPKLGGKSPVMARFGDIVARVTAVWWDIVKDPKCKLSAPVFRPTANSNVQTSPTHPFALNASCSGRRSTDRHARIRNCRCCTCMPCLRSESSRRVHNLRLWQTEGWAGGGRKFSESVAFPMLHKSGFRR